MSINLISKDLRNAHHEAFHEGPMPAWAPLAIIAVSLGLWAAIILLGVEVVRALS